ncbi:MAG: hypothetical protein K8F34_16620 [Candidatus Kuenenia stuttgartiensis]|nr:MULTISPECIES: hypothetical protein [Kuenenia]MBE7546266.1 hypothetical protein [Planctomycetia bacterium]MBZ0193294.1 hypothetical protein [Candidatus Kuenenia stuttgartiensis]MCZ7623557.1 hypothetical protein [Candidatus Kuenenia sp.]
MGLIDERNICRFEEYPASILAGGRSGAGMLLILCTQLCRVMAMFCPLH